MEQQKIENMQGEVAFRKKIYQQQVENMNVLENEFTASAIEDILADRMKRTLEQMTRLQRENIAVSPYLEIGAERCQRTLIMENDLGLQGAAADISFDMLKSCNHYKVKFNKEKNPLRICCDANNLPFRSNSIPFVFCYEFLHHFPEPTPITKEAYRVLLPGGHFFFEEEPYKRALHFNFYTEKSIFSEEYRNRSLLRKIFGHFFARHTCNEVNHGIIENENISLKVWKRALEHFETKDVTVSTPGFVQSDLFRPSSWLKFFAAYVLGGTIFGMCRKAGQFQPQSARIEDTLICPACRTHGHEIPVRPKDAAFICPQCSTAYPIIDDVVFLLAHDKLAILYPDVFNAIGGKEAQ